MSLRDRFGTRSAVLPYLVGRMHATVGRYPETREVEWGRVGRLVFVCKGNICRSAYCDALAQREGIATASFGTSALDGEPADGTAQIVAAERGVDLHGHQTRSASQVALQASDLLVYMEPLHFNGALDLQQAAEAQGTFLLLWGSKERSVYLHDPFSASANYYRRCFDLADDAMAEIIIRLRMAEAPAVVAAQM